MDYEAGTPEETLAIVIEIQRRQDTLLERTRNSYRAAVRRSAVHDANMRRLEDKLERLRIRLEEMGGQHNDPEDDPPQAGSPRS